MREDDAGLRHAHHGCNFAQIRHAVGQLQVIADRRVKRGTEDARGLLSFFETLLGGRGTIHLHRAAVAGAEVEVVNVPAALLEQQQGSGSDELDVVGMGEDGEGRGHWGNDE